MPQYIISCTVAQDWLSIICSSIDHTIRTRPYGPHTEELDRKQAHWSVV